VTIPYLLLGQLTMAGVSSPRKGWEPKPEPRLPLKHYEPRAAASGPLSATVKGSYSGPPMTLGNAASACVRLIVCCRDCGHQVETEPTEMALDTAPRLPLSINRSG